MDAAKIRKFLSIKRKKMDVMDKINGRTYEEA